MRRDKTSPDCPVPRRFDKVVLRNSEIDPHAPRLRVEIQRISFRWVVEILPVADNQVTTKHVESPLVPSLDEG